MEKSETRENTVSEKISETESSPLLFNYAYSRRVAEALAPFFFPRWTRKHLSHALACFGIALGTLLLTREEGFWFSLFFLFAGTFPLFRWAGSPGKLGEGLFRRDDAGFPNKTFSAIFGPEVLRILVKSDRTEARYDLSYDKIEKAVQNGDVVAVLFHGLCLPVDLRGPEYDREKALSILRHKVKGFVPDPLGRNPRRTRALKRASKIFWYGSFVSLFALAAFHQTRVALGWYGTVPSLVEFLAILVPTGEILVGIFDQKEGMRGEKIIAFGIFTLAMEIFFLIFVLKGWV